MCFLLTVESSLIYGGTYLSWSRLALAIHSAKQRTKACIYLVKVSSLVLRPVRGVWERLGAAIVLTQVGLLTGVWSHVDLKIFKAWERLVAAIKLENRQTNRKTMNRMEMVELSC